MGLTSRRPYRKVATVGATERPPSHDTPSALPMEELLLLRRSDQRLTDVELTLRELRSEIRSTRAAGQGLHDARADITLLLLGPALIVFIFAIVALAKLIQALDRLG